MSDTYLTAVSRLTRSVQSQQMTDTIVNLEKESH